MNFRRKYWRGSRWTAIAVVCGLMGMSAQPSTAETTLLFSDEFDSDLSQWVVEKEEGGTVSVQNGVLDLNVDHGATVWFRQRLQAPVRISYQATQIDAGGANDRVSDLNCFWMATDLLRPNDFWGDLARQGSFRSYHKLQLYYVGDGGGHNTTTRFRRYPGTGKRPLRPEHDLGGAPYRLLANKSMQIEISSRAGRIQYRRDGVLFFDVADPHPFTEGWFAFRTLTSHIQIDHFRVERLTD